MAPNLPFKVSQLDRQTEPQKLTISKLNNPDLFKDKSLVGGEWVEAKSGKRFDVYGTTATSTTQPIAAD
jgi:hypothetical protein